MCLTLFIIFSSLHRGWHFSPFIFRLYIRDLIGSFTDLRLGYNVAGTTINLPCFVDDMVLLACRY